MTEERTREQGAILYRNVCLVALAVILAVLLRLRLDLFSLFPVGVGLIGLATRWVSAPAVLLLSLAACLHYMRDRFRQAIDDALLPVPFLVLSAAALAYVIAHFRLQSLTVNVFPRDPRRDENKPRWRLGPLHLSGSKIAGRCRPEALVSSQEIGVLLLSLPAWTAWALASWKLLTVETQRAAFDDPALWRCILIAWVGGIGAFVVTHLIGYWARRRMSRQEAFLLLQDAFWQETRGEQRRMQRRLAAARLRQAKSRGPS